MTNPPNNQYSKPFVPGVDHARTADRQPIIQGMRVFTNNLDRGTVDLSRAKWEWHGPEGVYHLWFDVKVDITYRGKATEQSVQQSDDRVVTKFQGESA